MAATAVVFLFLVQANDGSVTLASIDVTVAGGVMYPANGYFDALASVPAVVPAYAGAATRLMTSTTPAPTAATQANNCDHVHGGRVHGDRVTIGTVASFRRRCSSLLVDGATAGNLPAFGPPLTVQLIA